MMEEEGGANRSEEVLEESKELDIDYICNNGNLNSSISHSSSN